MDSIYSFGDWIRRRRKSLDLTQACLASQVGCALVTIKKIEQGERRPSRQMAERLADCLSIQNSERPAFIQAARSQLPPDRLPPTTAEHPSSRTLTRLPQPVTRLIGRRKEVSEAARMLRRHMRLLTITGVGGVGKTRVALAVAQAVEGEFRDGVVFVSLASTVDPGLVPAKIAQELGLKEDSDRPIQETLCTLLSDQEILLLLDNFEQLLPAGPYLADLLLAAPELHLLVTSRSLLHLSGETVLTIQPLGLPGASAGLVSDRYLRKIARSDAVRLFLQRAKARDTAFRLSKENCHQVAELCHRLDGLPLAIELAASRVREYPLAFLQEGLSQRLELLGDGFRDLPRRQQTLRGTFDWSFSHLEPAEQGLLPRLGVFYGSFNWEAVLAVCNSCSESELLAALAGLVDKNMIFRTEEGERYNLLETAHEYALECLEATGQAANTRRAHLAYFAQLVETARPHLWDEEQGKWLAKLALEIDNLRGALGWALSRETAGADEMDLGGRMAASLWYFWYLYGALQEGGTWLAAALRRIPQSNQTRARLLLADGTLAWQQGKVQAAARQLRESIDLFRILEDGHGLAEAMHMYGHIVFDHQDYGEAESIFRESLAIYESLGDSIIRISLIGDLGMVACHQGHLASAREYYEQSLALYIQNGIRDGEAQASIRLGDLARLEGDYEKATDLYERSLQINRELKITLEIACSLHKLGFTALYRGDAPRAEALFHESLALQHESGNQQGIAECLAGLASLRVAEEDYEDAARYFGAASQILTRTGLPIAPADLAEWQRDEEVARARCDPQCFEQAWMKGMGETVDSIVASLFVPASAPE